MAKDKDWVDIRNHKMSKDYILVKAVNPNEAIDDELTDPTQYEDKAEWGEVLSVGKGRVTESGFLIEPSVKVGQIITFGKYSAYKTRIAGIDYLIIRDDDVMSVHG